MTQKLLGALALVCLQTAVVWAEPEDAGAVAPPVESAGSEPSLEELLDPTATIASKRSEKVSEAAASVTVYTAEEIKQLGYYTLSDLASITPGYARYYEYGQDVLVTRGQKAGSFNNNDHLVYVDGIPVYYARNYYAPVGEQLPLLFANRVELMSGPSSALYGTGAFYGVLNVVPNEPNGVDAQVRATAGTRGEQRLGGTASYADEDRAFRLTAGYFAKPASQDYVGTTNDPTNRLYDNENAVFINPSFAFRTSALRGLTVGAFYLREQNGLGEFWQGGNDAPSNNITFEDVIPYVKYQRRFSDLLSASAFLEYNAGLEKGYYSDYSTLPGAAKNAGYAGAGELFGTYEARVNDIQGQAELSWNIADRTDLITGVNLDSRRAPGSPDSYSLSVSADPTEPYSAEPTLAAGSDRFWLLSAYAQLHQGLPLLQGLALTLGAREDFGYSTSQTYNQFSPRASVVQRFADHFTFRLSYATALVAPGIKEIGLNEESQTRSASNAGGALPEGFIKPLVPESIQSLEAGPGFNSEHISANLTAFVNRTKNALNGVAVKYQNQPYNIFVNDSGTTTAVGGEASLQVAPTRDLRFRANYSVAQAKDSEGKFTVDVPTQTANFWATYRLRAPIKLQATGVVRWVAAWQTEDATHRPPGYVLADANLVWSALPALDLELQGRNLLNAHPQLPQGGAPYIPLAGVSVLGSADLHF